MSKGFIRETKDEDEKEERSRGESWWVDREEG